VLPLLPSSFQPDCTSRPWFVPDRFGSQVKPSHPTEKLLKCKDCERQYHASCLPVAEKSSRKTGLSASKKAHVVCYGCSITDESVADRRAFEWSVDDLPPPTEDLRPALTQFLPVLPQVNILLPGFVKQDKKIIGKTRAGAVLVSFIPITYSIKRDLRQAAVVKSFTCGYPLSTSTREGLM
jgi:hypothetical protein